MLSSVEFRLFGIVEMLSLCISLGRWQYETGADRQVLSTQTPPHIEFDRTARFVCVSDTQTRATVHVLEFTFSRHKQQRV